MKHQSQLILVDEAAKIYTHANKGHAYWMPREDWPIESRPVPKRLPSYMIPLHLPWRFFNRTLVREHRLIMAGFTRGKGFRTT